MSDLDNRVDISWDTSGYSMMKNLDVRILGALCEFIDNSIASYKIDKNEIRKVEKGYKLKVSILHEKEKNQIIIKDNAGGINEKNFTRAMKPSRPPEDTSGLNEFGLGMKYAAVWLCDEWELKSTAFGEEVERKVIFNYNDVIKKRAQFFFFGRRRFTVP